MDRLQKKIADETKKTLDFLDLRAWEIFVKELQLHHKEAVPLGIKLSFWSWPTGDPKKKKIYVESFVKTELGKPAKKFKSETEFNLEGSLWVPRSLKLETETGAVEHFISNVEFVKDKDQLPIDYVYNIEGPVRKKREDKD